MDNLREVGRIAFRVEGKWWNAYYALPDTLKGSIHLGSILMSVVQNPEAKEAFISAMRHGIGGTMEELLGTETSWKPPRDAPDSERSGNA